MRWATVLSMVVALALGVGTAALAAGGGDPSATPAVELHLDTLVTTGTSPDATTPDGTTPDASGNGLSATASATPRSDGRFAGAFDLSYSDNGVTVPDNTLLRPAGGVTVMAWVRGYSNPGAGKLVVGKALATGCQRLSYGLVTGAGGGLQFDATTSDNGAVEHATGQVDASAVWDTHWHAIAGTYDGSTLSLYEDGVLKQTLDVGSQPLLYNTDDPPHTGLYAGTAAMPNSCNPAGTGFGGDIDEMRVYDRALSPAELQTLQSASATTPPELPQPTTPTTAPPTTTPSTPSTPSGPTGAPPATSTAATPPTSPPAPVAAPAPAAVFTAPGSVPKFGRLLLDATGTHGAATLQWDINGDGHADIVRSASQPVLAIRVPAPGVLPVKLTAVAPSGATSVVTHAVTVTGSTPPKALFNRIGPVATAVSAATAGFFAGAAQTATSCSASQQTLTFGLAEAIGCFTQVTDVAKVPTLERQVVQDHYASERQTAIVSIICRQAEVGRQPQSACDHAKATLPPPRDLDVYVTKHAVKLNGITITPIGPASVVVYPSLQRVISSAAIVKWGDFPVAAGPLDWDLHNQTVHTSGKSTGPFPPQGKATLLSFTLKNVADVAGFHPGGQVQLSLETVDGKYSSTGSVAITLPSEFSTFGGKAPSAQTKLVATNASGPVLDNLDLEVPEADLGPVDLSQLSFRYERYGGIDNDHNPGTACAAKEWKATAVISLPGSDGGNAAGLILRPPPSQNGVEWCNGSFKSVGAQLNFGGPIPPPELFPGVFLDNINFAMQLHPTLLRGGATISAAELTRISGTLLAVFAHPWEPYKLDRADAGGDLQDLAGRTFTSTTFAVGGQIAVHVPGVGELNLFHGGAFYSYPDFVGLGAKVQADLGIFQVNGSIGGEFALQRHLFEVDAAAHLCVVGFDVCGGGLLVASEKGAVACVSVSVLGDTLNPGIGVKTNGHVDVWLPDGCKPSHYWSAARRLFGSSRSAHAATASTPLSFTVARGETAKSLRIEGRGGAPHVLVAAPGGTHLAITGDGPTAQGTLQALSAGGSSTTWLGIDHGRPGRYTITPLPGSVPVTSLAETRPGYDTDFAARVTGHGDHRVLHYDARKRGGGQRVTFFEEGASVSHPLATSAGGVGTVRFRPAPGAGGRRTIVARATVDGSPIRSQRLAHFRFAGTPRTPRAGRVSVRRHGTRLEVRWTAGVGAVHSAVVLRLANGAMRSYRLGTRHSLRIRGVRLDLAGSIQVSTQGALGDWSRPRSARFPRSRAPFTVQQTNRHNERRNLS